MVQELRNNPIITVLLALLIAAITVMGAMHNSHLANIQANMQHSFDMLWNKLDRVTNFMQQKEDSLRAEQRAQREELICIGKELTELKIKSNNNQKGK